MQALILAAGMGKRLGPLTESQTKCMVKVHDRSLLERSLDILAGAGVSRFVLVVGYHADGVHDLIGDSYAGVPVIYVHNLDYASTNNIYSLYLARDEFGLGDTLLLESDLIYEPEIIRKLLAHPAPNVAVVDRHEAWMDGTVVTLSDDGTIRQFIPKQDMNPTKFGDYYKTVNIYKFSKDYIQRSYLPFLEAYVRAVGSNEYYEQVLRVIAGIDKQGLQAMPLAGEKWYEIDDTQDLEIAWTLFAPAEMQYSSYLNRHGGYWRFPELRDFCYLVNPYFPPETMLEEMRRSFDVLLREYPSSAAVQAHLAAKMFSCRADSITVGNGAAELISALGQEIDPGRVGVSVPTFEEYLKRFPGSEVVGSSAGAPDFDPGLDRLKDLADRTDAVVLVNPDNPSGRCLSASEVLEFARYVESAGKRLILDESFVDFAEPDHCTSLLHQGMLEAHPGLVIVKSISKSYGVPGARLGVLATADTELLARVRCRTPIWNVNSFGEYFLQIIGKYQNDYEEACRRIRAERARIVGRLSCVPGLRVIPSHANYVLCEVIGPIAAGVLAERLLREYGILIKDASKKPGLAGGEYIRIAVKDEVDNDYLVTALGALVTGGA